MASLALLLTPAFTRAQEAAETVHRAGGGFGAEALLWGVVHTFIYGIVGIALAALGTKVFQWVMPFSVKDELEKDHNLSVGVVMAAMVLGICLIVAATISS